MRAWHGIVLGIIMGVAIIYLPQIIHPTAVPSLAGAETSKEGITAVGIEEVAGAELPVLIAIAGLGIGVAFAVYLLSRGRE